MYSEVTYSVKLQSGLTDHFLSNIDVKQGCILSPLLFNLFVNDLPHCFEKEKCAPIAFNLFVNDLPHCFEKEKCAPIAFGDLFVNSLMYADDIVLLSESKEGLQNCLSSLQTYCDLWHLR